MPLANMFIPVFNEDVWFLLQQDLANEHGNKIIQSKKETVRMSARNPLRIPLS